MHEHDSENTGLNNSAQEGKQRNLIIAAVFAALLISVVVIAFVLQDRLQFDLDLAQLTPEGTAATLAGETAPDFTFLGEQGHELRLSDYAGTPIVLNFWASWCPPCRMHLPHFQEAFERYGNEVKFIMINFDEPIDVARDYIDGAGYSFDIYFDAMREGATAYGVTGIPETFFIDADGIVTEGFLGPISYEVVARSIQTMTE